MAGHGSRTWGATLDRRAHSDVVCTVPTGRFSREPRIRDLARVSYGGGRLLDTPNGAAKMGEGDHRTHLGGENGAEARSHHSDGPKHVQTQTQGIAVFYLRSAALVAVGMRRIAAAVFNMERSRSE